MSRTARISAATTIGLAAALLGSATSMAADWTWNYYSTKPNDPHQNAEPLVAIANWINDTCKPSSMLDIRVVTSGGAEAGADYNIHAFCKPGTGNPIKVKPMHIPWGAGGAPQIADNMQDGDIIFAYYFHGHGPKAEEIMALKKQ